VRRLLLILAFISLFVAAASWASSKEGEPFGPIAPDELKLTSEPLAPGAPAIILLRQLDRDDSDVRGTRESNYFRIKIMTEEGRKYADIEIPFLKQNGKASDIVGVKARTIRPDGSIVNFEVKPYNKQIVKAKGVKYQAKTFTMPDVQVGSIIEYAYTEVLPDFAIYDSRWILSDELFTRKAKFSLKPYLEDFRLRWSWNNLPEGTAAPKEGPDHVIRMEAANIPAFPAEDYMPPENELKSRVDFVYSSRFITPELDKFWKEIGKQRNKELEDFVGKRKAMEVAVAQIVSPGDSQEVKLQKIYARVQQLRNTSFELQKTEEEQKREKLKEVKNVEDVWKRGYGNGGELTWLFLGLVRAAKFDAYGVWVSERRNYFFNRNSMDDRKLDENVVLVKLDGQDLYLDPGFAFTPFGLLPWSETGVQGLRLDKDGGTWVTTVLPNASVSQVTNKANLRLSEEGDLEGELTVNFNGLEAHRLRTDEQHEDETARKKYLEDKVKQEIPVACEVTLTNKPDWSASSPSFTAEFKIKVPGWMAGMGRRAMLPIGLFTAGEKNIFVHAERKHPIYFSFPFSRQDDVTVTLPLGWQVASLPPARNEGGGPILYTIKAEKDGSTLHLTRSLKIDLLLLDNKKYYSDLRNFFQVIRTGDEEQAILQPIGSRASN
jgi:Domain of Unknown Function with PDB structure (DUF3857)